MASILNIHDFITKFHDENLCVLDVRSEHEFLHGHLPGAINLPLLKNDEREIIGTLYKKKGREEAVKKGFELVGPRFADIISEAERLVPSRKLMLYCWRGGMRSNITAWLLNMSGFQVFLLKGGYKSWRSWCLEQFTIRKKVVVIGGKTGSGKTALLQALSDDGKQVINLEGFAHHKGSAFGGLGQKPQPSTEHFENLIALNWAFFNKDEVIWIENESRSIGSNIIPLGIFEQMREAIVAEIVLDDETRKKRILQEYGHFPLDVLAENTRKVAKRLGGLRLKEALGFLENNNLSGWVDIMLDYYDDTYEFSNSQRDQEKLFSLNLPNDNMHEHVLMLTNKINKVFMEEERNHSSIEPDEIPT